ncbi:L-aminoadipate-semialdehyde dehydrogenase [Cryptococcus deuterogattii 99/473]|uniref:Unplaced genomic scaffold supercont1.2, whole genome shotgun sequence n=1 Tax=Cryptococcus deuterogattii Ram5 TaxID=1296110 RepID=A0A0D0VE64_9TREE|nr:L-aminoadipate-semialdehyde dehydrogenase [Cryptococcus deuterogattii Ram5]KIY56447.1 L-aminoadipate-semialdehyde dehydrogenase [Cryptococcus deuterogattii 99/473]
MPVPTFLAQSVTELISLRAETQANDAAIHTGASEYGEKLMTLTYSDLSKAVDRLAAHYAALNIQPECGLSEVPPERIVAVLTSTAIDETLLEIALAKLGLASLLLSVNNSTAAVAHLCKVTKSAFLIYGPKFEETAKDAQKLLAQDGIEIGIIPETRYPLWGPEGVRESKVAPYPPRLTPQQESKRTCVVLHSSGSTGFPKPVFISHYGLLANAAQSLPKTGFSALPLFHGFGHFSVFRCIYHGKTFTLMPPNLPLTSANICRIIRSSPTPPVQHFAVPYVLKLLGETEEGIQTLANFEAVSFAGAAVPDDLGDRLVEAGVNLISFYGTTETGALMTSRRDFDSDKGWNWLRAEGPIADYLELIPQGSDTFEAVVKDGWPAKIMSNREDGAYCTKDLVLRHPQHKTWFKYIGRLDDTLTQTLGEKTNPVPIELAIRGNSSLIQECIVFGDGRPQTGALILPSEQGAELSKDKKAYIEAIWPVIADANSHAPTHSRILPEMVDVLPYGTEIPVATKMSILRPACYKKFASIIDAIYERFERGTGEPKQDISSKPEMESFLNSTILQALGEKASPDLSPSTDLFSYGVDSLQATRVRNVITKSLELGDAKIGQNIVYEYPSISQLADYLLEVKSGKTGQNGPEKDYKTMWEMVERYTAQLIKEDSSAAASDVSSNGHFSHVIVLTGATGSLGAHILDQLVRRPDVSKVVCLSRAKSHEDSLLRVQGSLSQRLRTLTPECESKIVSYAADVNRPDLGLSAEEYEGLRRESTAVIHNAWPVNFVLSIESYNEHIGGATNLLNLTLKSPKTIKPAFFFSSSVGTRQGQTELVVGEDFPESPETAHALGYGRSKWVVEKIMERAGKETKARCGVLRIGQLAGDTENGVWNETEAWPLMFKTVDVIQALPMLDEKPSWLPVNQAAATISEIVTSISISSIPSSAEVYHVLNPYLGSWSDILSGLSAAGLKFDIVSRAEWLDRLSKSNPDVTVNPTYKLLGFYQNRLGKKDERPTLEFKVDRTEKESATMRDQVKKVGPELAAVWAKRWRQSGFLH